MKQIALDIGLETAPTLASFFAGPNEPALGHLRLWAGSPTRSPVPTYLWGTAGSGKTHLLRAVQHALREQGASAGWLDATVHEPPEYNPDWSVLLLDDVQLFTAVQQHAAFNWFVNAQTHQRGVLAAGLLPPADLALREDLRTRLGWGHVFHLQVLSEAGILLNPSLDLMLKPDDQLLIPMIDRIYISCTPTRSERPYFYGF